MRENYSLSVIFFLLFICVYSPTAFIKGISAVYWRKKSMQQENHRCLTIPSLRWRQALRSQQLKEQFWGAKQMHYIKQNMVRPKKFSDRLFVSHRFSLVQHMFPLHSFVPTAEVNRFSRRWLPNCYTHEVACPNAAKFCCRTNRKNVDNWIFTYFCLFLRHTSSQVINLN